MNGLLRRIIIALLLGVVVYGAFVGLTGYRRIQVSLTHFQYRAFALALALASGNYAVRVLKWEYYLARLGIQGIGKLDSALIFLSGFVLTVTPDKIGEIFKSVVLARTHNVSAARTAPIVVAERLTDLIGIIILIIIGTTGFSGGTLWAGIGAVLALMGMILVVWQRPQQLLLNWTETGPRRLRKWTPKVGEALTSLRVLAGPGALLWPSLLSVIAWGFEGLALYYILVGFGVVAGVPAVVFFYSTATLAGAVIPVPGGLGVTETMIQEQLVQLGDVTPGTATAAMILVRFATLWWAVVVGFIALGILRGRYPSLAAKDELSLDPG